MPRIKSGATGCEARMLSIVLCGTLVVFISIKRFLKIELK